LSIFLVALISYMQLTKLLLHSNNKICD
jgi:hypothetical protein